jgi:hypothetical protein
MGTAPFLLWKIFWCKLYVLLLNEVSVKKGKVNDWIKSNVKKADEGLIRIFKK